MKKILLTLCVFSSLLAQAQDDRKWMLDFSSKGIAGTSSIQVKENVSRNIALLGADVHFRYLFNEISESQSLSLGTHALLGLAGDEDGTIFGVDLPALVEYNLGRDATRNSTNRFGIYFGGGYDFLISSWTDAGTIFAHGPIANTGFKFKLIGVNYHIHSSLMKPINQPGVVIGVGLAMIPARYSRAGKGATFESESRSGWEWIY